MEKEKKIFDAMQEDIENANIPDSEKAEINEKFIAFKGTKNKSYDYGCYWLW